MHSSNIIDLAADVITIVAFLGIPIGWFITRRDQKAKGNLAMDQINKMATNCFPTMQKDLTSLNVKTDDSNNHLEKQTELLVNMDKNIAILVDRGGRV